MFEDNVLLLWLFDEVIKLRVDEILVRYSTNYKRSVMILLFDFV